MTLSNPLQIVGLTALVMLGILTVETHKACAAEVSAPPAVKLRCSALTDAVEKAAKKAFIARALNPDSVMFLEGDSGTIIVPRGDCMEFIVAGVARVLNGTKQPRTLKYLVRLRPYRDNIVPLQLRTYIMRVEK